MALDDPRVVLYIEAYEDHKNTYIVMDHLDGVTLRSKLASEPQGKVSEKLAATYLRQLLKAVAHCHGRDIVHRKISPETVILIGEGNQLRLTGFASFPAKQDATRRETLQYIAPEVMSANSYDARADIWSIGVILYTLVSGLVPFQGATKRDVYDESRNGNYSFRSAQFQGVSPECRDLISQMLMVDPDDRISVKEALGHDWFEATIPD